MKIIVTKIYSLNFKVAIADIFKTSRSRIYKLQQGRRKNITTWDDHLMNEKGTTEKLFSLKYQYINTKADFK